MLIRISCSKALLRLSLGLVCLAAAAPVQAQIYSWKDANGNLVLSNKQEPGTNGRVRSYAVPKADSVRVTRYATPEQSRNFDDLIFENARLKGVRADLVRAVVQVESAFNPNARSPKGAMGLMQLMPATMKQFGVTNAYNPAENVRAGVAYLRALLDRYENNEVLALAAYNAGPGAVDKYGASVPPYRETQNYVAKVNQVSGVPLARRSSSVIYKVTEMVNGQPQTRYTDQKPKTGAFEVLGTR
jgi:soluble lytic murein transglycosylase-like protein